MKDLRKAGAFAAMAEAPQDGSLLIGRDAAGDEFLMRWRTEATILKEDGPDDQRPPYWARWHSDRRVAPVEWAPTLLTPEDVMHWA